VGGVTGREWGGREAWRPPRPGRRPSPAHPAPHRAHSHPTPLPSVTGYIKLALPAGKANPAPPVGPALGAKVRGGGVGGGWGVRGPRCVRIAVPRMLRGPRVAVVAAATARARPRPRRGRAAGRRARPRARTHTPLPPPSPRPQGVNIMDFCKQYNAATQDKAGTIIPVEITVYEDRSFTFILKTPPASVLLTKAAGIEKGSGNPKTEKVGTVTRAQVREIAEIKLPDLNATSVEPAMRIIEGTAANMGIEVVEA